MSTSTELVIQYLGQGVVTYAELQDYMLWLGFFAMVWLLILKVYYLFFNRI